MERAERTRPSVAVVASHPIQHFCPLYRALAADGRVKLKVFFASRDGADGYFDSGFNRVIQWKGNLLEGYEHEFLPGAEETKVAGSVDSKHVGASLAAFDPDVVQVYGFWHGVSRRAISWSRKHAKRVMVVSDSELRTRRGMLTRLRKRFTVPFFLSRVDAFLTIGDCNEDYYLAYGAKREQFFRSPYPIDDRSLDEAFAKKAELRSTIRTEFEIPQRALVGLVVGKLTARKCPQHVLEALAILQREPGAPEMHLVFAGDGPLRHHVEAAADRVAPGRAHFPGFVNIDRLPAFYVASDFLVHPSSEDPHPLATSEAVYCGLPVIVSDRVGSVGPTDDVRPGVNGIQYQFGDVGELARSLRSVADGGVREAMGHRAKQIGRGRDLRASVEGFVQGARALCGTQSRSG